MKKLNASEAKQRFGEMLDTVQQEPVVIQRSGRDKAVVLSIRDYKNIVEDKYLGEKAQKVERKGKYLGKKESENLLKAAKNAGS